MTFLHRGLLSATVAGLLAMPGVAQAETSADLALMREEIRALRSQLQRLQDKVGAQETRERRARVAAPPAVVNGRVVKGPLPIQAACGNGGLAIGESVCFKPGGFAELAGVFRTRNAVSDVATDFNGIPFGNVFANHEKEFRFSARQSRVSGLVTADVNPSVRLNGYLEVDFLAAGVTSNSRESNSYVPRIRQGWASIDLNDVGVHVLAGQAWSLLTTNTTGIVPLKEQVPLTIDAQYVPGFTWLRVPQVRIVGQISPALWAGVSLETPQAVLPPGPFAAPATVNVNNPGSGAGLLNSTTTYSNDTNPDVVGKLAFDPGFGHFETKGVVRRFTDRTFGRTNDAWGYGVGGAVTLPIIAGVFDVQASGLIGRGIGRYGSSQLPDFALRANGAIATVPESQLLVGAVLTPMAGTQIYAYAGWEHARRTGDISVIGYGSPTLVTIGCTIENAAAGTCQAQTRDLKQVTAGFWQDIYKGPFGRAVLGAQGSYTVRNAFSGLGGAPATNVGSVFASLRYYPFPP